MAYYHGKNVGKPTLTTIRHSLTVERRSSIWSFTFGLLGIIIAVTLATLLGYAILTWHFLTLRQCVTRWVTLLLPKSVRALMQPPGPTPSGGCRMKSSPAFNGSLDIWKTNSNGIATALFFLLKLYVA
jgi:hypothetical protein